MTTTELEQLLEAGIETPRIEYKGPCEWDVDLFAKDILAITNIEDGGWIVIGIQETSNEYERVGVTEAQAQSFVIDTMRDQFSKFADSHVTFSAYFPKDKNDTKFVVIKVDEFREIPVICIKSSDSAGTKAPIIYYRNTDKKVESGPISNYHDLRNLIERGAAKVRRRWKELGLEVPDTFDKKLRQEFEELI
jgi:predicted HTH transcriptional regulator